MTAPIQIFCEKLAVVRGHDYFTNLQALRHHLASISDDEFLAEMVRVDNKDIFGYLWSGGLSAARQQMANKRWEELSK